MWTLLREVSWRHARHAPLRTLLVVFGIALGVSTWSAVLATNRSLNAAFVEMVEDVSGGADLIVSGGSSGIPGALLDELRELPGVEHIAAAVEVVTRTPGAQSEPILVLGVDFLGDTFFLPWAEDEAASAVEDPLAFVNDPTAILLTTTLARERGVGVGDELRLLTSDSEQTFHVRGLIEPTGPAAVFAGQVAVMFLDAAQISFGRGRAVDRIDVGVRAGHAPGAVEARLRRQLRGRAEVGPPAARSARLAASLGGFQFGLNLSAAAALLVGMFLIYNAVSVSVAQRRREAGIVRSLGATKRMLVALFCLEALLMALLGAALGLLLAQQLAAIALASVERAISQVVLPIRPPAPVISASIAAAGTAAGLVSTLAAAYVPARRTSRIEPAEALRATRSRALISSLPVGKLGGLGLLAVLGSWLLLLRGDVPGGYAAVAVLLVGMTMTVPISVVTLRRILVAVVERWLGAPGRLALDNVERALGRSTMTIAALMLAVSTSVSVAAFAGAFEASLLQWADTAFAADATVTKGSPLADRQALPFSPGALDSIRELAGIAAINPVRLTYQQLQGRRIQLAASDTRLDFEQGRRTGRQRRVLAGPRVLAPSALFAAPRALISENLSKALGLRPGDELRLATGVGERAFVVHAVVVDYASDQGSMLIDRRWYEQYWNDRQIDAADLHFARSADQAALIRQVRARLGEVGGLFVTSHDELRGLHHQVAKGVFAVAEAPDLIAFLVAIMGVLGTMLAAVLDRVPEIGALRALGASRRQVALSTVTESAFMGLAALICGVLSGALHGYLLLRVISQSMIGWTLPYSFPLGATARTAVFVVAAAICAGFLPGRRAARLDLKTALAYE
jgi:putative ABC transport system permease protein